MGKRSLGSYELLIMSYELENNSTFITHNSSKNVISINKLADFIFQYYKNNKKTIKIEITKTLNFKRLFNKTAKSFKTMIFSVIL